VKNTVARTSKTPYSRRAVKDFEGKVAKNEDLIRFKLKYDHDDLEDVMSYNKILDYVERENNNEDGHHWKFRTPVGHK
jgi:hypothetical protein